MKKEKLIFVLPEYDVNASTHFKYTVELAEALAEKMELFLFVEDAKSPLEGIKVQHAYGQKFRFLPLVFLERFFVVLLWRIRGCRKIYIHYAYLSGLIGALVMRLTRGKSFYWHCEQRAMFEVKFQFTKKALHHKLLQDWPFRLLIRVVHVLVTCTEVMREYYPRHFSVSPKKISVIYNWVNVAELQRRVQKPCVSLKKKYEINPHDKIILFVHWLSPRKGSRRLPEIMEAILSKRKDVTFLIVGGGPDESTLRTWVREKGWDNKIKLTSEVPNDEIPEYFSVGTIFIVPSENEEFGRVNIEAMAMGLPIVATKTLATKAIFSTMQQEYCGEVGDIS